MTGRSETAPGPILIDTSLWIEALRRDGSPIARRDEAAIVESGLALVNGLIVSELLKGAYSGPSRPLIPIQIGHPFRFIPATCSD